LEQIVKEKGRMVWCLSN